jgi:hypothetical protein
VCIPLCIFVCVSMRPRVHVHVCASSLAQGGPHKGWFRVGDKSTIMRVIYSNAQAYPSYLVTFTKTAT